MKDYERKQNKPRGIELAVLLIVSAFRRYAMIFGMSYLPLSSMRVVVLRVCGVKVGRDCFIGFNVIADTNYAQLISIADHVTISHNVSLVTHTASPVKSWLAEKYFQVAPITIGKGAWIGINSTVLPGVSIGENCMIGAGSVVVRDTEANSLYVGNPARKVRSLILDLEEN